MKRRRFKRHHWGWIIGLALITLVLIAPIDVFVAFVLETRQKVEITTGLINSLTSTTKAATSLMVALAALIFYKVAKRK